jgi:hypothetical protein
MRIEDCGFRIGKGAGLIPAPFQFEIRGRDRNLVLGTTYRRVPLIHANC